MSFRSSMRNVALCAALTVAMGVLTFLTGRAFFESKPGDLKGYSRGYRFGGSAVIMAGAAFCTWLFWTSRVTVENDGVRWREGTSRGFLAWDEIEGFGHRRAQNTLRIGLVRKATGEIHFLPVMNAELYRLLQPQCGSLPPEIVREAKLG